MTILTGKTLNMGSPHQLTHWTVDDQVSSGRKGNYALGYMSEEDGTTFIVCYVGRSDSDLNERLHQWVDEERHPVFKFSYAESAKEAFLKECRNYHDFGGPVGKLGNKNHPDRPNGTDLKCPRCNHFGK